MGWLHFHFSDTILEQGQMHADVQCSTQTGLRETISAGTACTKAAVYTTMAGISTAPTFWNTMRRTSNGS